jgi:hypothetical protein
LLCKKESGKTSQKKVKNLSVCFLRQKFENFLAGFLAGKWHIMAAIQSPAQSALLAAAGGAPPPPIGVGTATVPDLVAATEYKRSLKRQKLLVSVSRLGLRLLKSWPS